jgi:hypothetical protein
MNESQKAIWDDFMTYSKTVNYVKTLLSQGENVVVVIGDRVTACHPYRDTTAPFEAAMTLQVELVRSGVALPIGNDGLPVFAFLAWNSTDPFDAPHEVDLVALAGRPTEAMEAVLDDMEKLGLARSVKPKNHSFEL